MPRTRATDGRAGRAESAGRSKKTSPEAPALTRAAANAGNRVNVDGREIRLSNLDKVLYDSIGFTKGQVIDYYARIAPVILPYLKGRPLTLKRYPDGVNREYFYEKMCPSHRPPWVATAKIESTHERRTIHYCLVEDTATLVWVANLASLELHTLLATADDIARPTFMVFDHDPGEGADILDCARVALRFHTMLNDLGLKSFAKTSGGKGLHVYVPLNTPVTFSETKDLSRAMAQLMERDDPKRVTSNMRKDLRPGKVFIDWSQNDHHKTTVTVYSLRAREYPTVSTPVAWEELEEALERKDASRLDFRNDQTLARVNKLGDLFAPVLKLKQTLPTVGH